MLFVGSIRALLAAKDAKAFAALQLGAIKPAVEKSVTYFGSVAGIFAHTRAELAKLVEAEAFVLGHNLHTALEALFKSAPFGAEAALQALKSAAANATAAYENASQVAKQVSDAAEASETSCSPDRPPKITPTRRRRPNVIGIAPPSPGASARSGLAAPPRNRGAWGDSRSVPAGPPAGAPAPPGRRGRRERTGSRRRSPGPA